ncbi:MAG TPA: ATP-binding protein [Drouetiella sp.]
MAKSTEKLLLSLLIRTETDVVLSRKRARQIAVLLGFDPADQTRISTATSEITRNALVHAGGGRLEFRIKDDAVPYSFIITMKDSGKGIENLSEILAGQLPGLGLRGAKKLMDQFSVETPDRGTTVRMVKLFSPRTPFNALELDSIANSLTRMMTANPADEVYQQNQELLLALDELSETETRLDKAYSALQQTNDDLISLNSQMKDWNVALERSVEERTAELKAVNLELLAARDAAIHANQLKTQFVMNISHEIRTPMAGILGLAEWLTLSDIQGEPKEISEHILRSANHLLSVVNDLLDFSKLTAGKLTLRRNDFYLSSIFEEVVQSVYPQAKKKNLSINNSIDTKASSKFVGDSQLLKQVLLNLAHNAVKFTEVGNIDISASVAESEKFSQRVRIEVKDDGIGISQVNQEKLFQPFVQVDGTSTRKYGGTGLGLAISKNIIEQMGGLIGCRSTPGEGSLFFIEIPLEKAG